MTTQCTASDWPQSLHSGQSALEVFATSDCSLQTYCPEIKSSVVTNIQLVKTTLSSYAVREMLRKERSLVVVLFLYEYDQRYLLRVLTQQQMSCLLLIWQVYLTVGGTSLVPDIYYHLVQLYNSHCHLVALQLHVCSRLKQKEDTCQLK